MAIIKTTTNVDTLKINYLTQEMYENALENDEINNNELYLTPEISRPLICTTSYSSSVENYVLDKTVQEIYDALLVGTPVYIKFQYGNLGVSGIGDYDSTLYLAPIIKIYGYSYTGVIRICASKPTTIGSINSQTFLLSPCVLIYSATSLNSYPTFYTSVYADSAYVGVRASVK